PILKGTVHPLRVEQLFAGLRVHPTEIDGELLQTFVPRAAEVDQEKDKRLGTLAKLQAECFTIHAAITQILHTEPWDFAAVYYPSIDHFSHGFMNYHPPRQPHISEQDFAIYGDVINSAYRFHDLMLGTLVKLAGEDTHVILVSDHGFHPDEFRPKALLNIPAAPAEQHRELGIFAMKGPGIRRDERLYGAGLLDIAPTVLSIFGLPAGADMPGRVLAEAFTEAPPLDRIPSWEDVPGEAGMHRADEGMSTQDAKALIDQFVALGYIERPDEDQQQAVDQCVRERMWNLARVYTSTGRHHLALPILEELNAELPERLDFSMALANAQSTCGLLEEAKATAQSAVAAYRDTPLINWLLAHVEFDLGNYSESLRYLKIAGEHAPDLPEFHRKLAGVYQKLRLWDDAAEAAGKALTFDPEDSRSWLLLARCHLHARRWEDAAHAALSAAGLQHDLTHAHLYLGVALARMGRLERARDAFLTATKLPGTPPAAYAWLYRLYKHVDLKVSWDNFQKAGTGRQRKVLRQHHISRLREEARARANERAQRPPRTSEPAETGRLSARPPGTRRAKDPGKSLDFVLVSGLPRSGTSLAMQMLHAAGVPIMTDGKRKADSDNPEGYWEWEEIKKLRKRPDILRKAEGKAIKVISMLLPFLPGHHRYKILFMDRPIEEVAASHAKMLSNRKRNVEADPEKVKSALERHRRAVLERLPQREGVDLMVIHYPDIIRDPGTWAARIAEFLGLDSEAALRMAQAVKPALYRNRS
ncbi:MAG: tetratricopeptide repeat protein, partial [Bryobacterales bacterium]|nr:tetratricopeptide repeat protein [Bryobacterales bacterium]